MREAVHEWDQGVYGVSLPYNFALNFKLLKNCLFLKMVNFILGMLYHNKIEMDQRPKCKT